MDPKLRNEIADVLESAEAEEAAEQDSLADGPAYRDSDQPESQIVELVESEEGEEGGPVRFDENQSFILKVDGEDREVKGAGLANVYRQRQDLEGRFKELKATQETIERAKGALPFAARKMAAAVMLKAGIMQPDGSWNPSWRPPGAPGPSPQEAAGDASESPEGLEVPKFDPSEIDEDDLMDPRFYEFMNRFSETVATKLSQLDQRLGALAGGARQPMGGPLSGEDPSAQPGQVGEVTAEQANAWEQECRAKLAEAGVPANKIDAGIDSVVDMYYSQGFTGELDQAAQQYASGLSGSGETPNEPEQETPTAEPEEEAPPAVGGGGSGPAPVAPRAGRGVGFGTLKSRKALMQQLKDMGVEG